MGKMFVAVWRRVGGFKRCDHLVCECRWRERLRCSWISHLISEFASEVLGAPLHERVQASPKHRKNHFARERGGRVVARDVHQVRMQDCDHGAALFERKIDLAYVSVDIGAKEGFFLHRGQVMS